MKKKYLIRIVITLSITIILTIVMIQINTSKLNLENTDLSVACLVFFAPISFIVISLYDIFVERKKIAYNVCLGFTGLFGIMVLEMGLISRFRQLNNVEASIFIVSLVLALMIPLIIAKIEINNKDNSNHSK